MLPWQTSEGQSQASSQHSGGHWEVRVPLVFLSQCWVQR